MHTSLCSLHACITCNKVNVMPHAVPNPHVLDAAVPASSALNLLLLQVVVVVVIVVGRIKCDSPKEVIAIDSRLETFLKSWAQSNSADSRRVQIFLAFRLHFLWHTVCASTCLLPAPCPSPTRPFELFQMTTTISSATLLLSRSRSLGPMASYAGCKSNNLTWCWCFFVNFHAVSFSPTHSLSFSFSLCFFLQFFVFLFACRVLRKCLVRVTNVELAQLSPLPTFSKTFCSLLSLCMFCMCVCSTWGQRFVLTLRVLHKTARERKRGRQSQRAGDFSRNVYLWVTRHLLSAINLKGLSSLCCLVSYPTLCTSYAVGKWQLRQYADLPVIYPWP